MRSVYRALACLFAAAALLAAAPLPVSAGPINDKMQKKIEIYKKQTVAWAADPLIVVPVKDANAKGPIPGMWQRKWKELKETDRLVSGVRHMPPASS